MAGMIWVDGLHYSPMAFLLMSAAFRAMDPSLEESATMSGASVWQVAWRVTLQADVAGDLRDDPDSVRALDRVVRGAGAARICPVGIEVFTSSIYTAVHRYPSQVGLASAYGVALLAITTVGVYCRLAAVQQRFEVRDDDRQRVSARGRSISARGAGSRRRASSCTSC